jgi:thiamine biosynthesis lipoprotein
MKKWSIFFIVLAVALTYGLVLRDKAPIDHVEQVPPPISAPLYAPAEDGPAELVKREVVLMGSQFVFAVDAPRQQALAAITAVTARLRKLEAEISSWKPGSDVYRLNDNAGQFIKVGADTLTLLQLSQQVYVETGGAFEITIGAVWDLYPFREPNAPLPGAEQIAAQLKFVGADRIALHLDESQAMVPVGMKVNLGGIGKGYAAQIAIELMQDMGIQNAAVSAGGDVSLMGQKRSGPWVIRIENPLWQGQTIEQFALQGRSVATSGNTQRYIVRKGKRYGHLINPLTGRPAEGTQSATVITENPALADAYATAVLVKGPAEGMQWVNGRVGVEALIIDDNGRVTRSTGWQAVTGGPL